jgi:hypothetical protein
MVVITVAMTTIVTFIMMIIVVIVVPVLGAEAMAAGERALAVMAVGVTVILVIAAKIIEITAGPVSAVIRSVIAVVISGHIGTMVSTVTAGATAKESERRGYKYYGRCLSHFFLHRCFSVATSSK